EADCTGIHRRLTHLNWRSAQKRWAGPIHLIIGARISLWSAHFAHFMMTVLPRSTDVFVIGGGPAGLAAAIAVRRRGFDVTVADCAIPPIDKACGEGIMPDGVGAAESLGISLKRAGAQPFPGIRFCEAGQ